MNGTEPLWAIFDDVIAFGNEVRAEVGKARDMSLAETSERMHDLLKQAEARALKAGHSSADVSDAMFAVTAWLDEVIATAAGSSQRPALLQGRLFTTANAGNEFFSRLQAIPASRVQPLQVFYLMLALGFVGQYAMSVGPQGELEDLRSDLAQRIGVSSPDATEPGFMFPQPAPRVLGAGLQPSGARGPGWSRYGIGGALVSVLALIALFLPVEGSSPPSPARASECDLPSFVAAQRGSGLSDHRMRNLAPREGYHEGEAFPVSIAYPNTQGFSYEAHLMLDHDKAKWIGQFNSANRPVGASLSSGAGNSSDASFGVTVAPGPTGREALLSVFSSSRLFDTPQDERPQSCEAFLGSLGRAITRVAEQGGVVSIRTLGFVTLQGPAPGSPGTQQRPARN